jgi:XRE family transcriptional regulator, regulator of sulfur utilization
MSSRRKTEELGVRIKRARERRKMSQAVLAEKAGIHRVSLANIERGAKIPTLSTLIRLAAALRLSPARLLL